MKKWVERFRWLAKEEKGLTLIELLAVIVVLGIIAAIAVPSISGILGNTKKEAHRANATQIVEAARQMVAIKGYKPGTDGAIQMKRINETNGSIENDKELKANSYMKIKLEDLINDGYFPKEGITNPEESGKYYDTADTVVYVLEDDKHNFDYWVNLRQKGNSGTNYFENMKYEDIVSGKAKPQ